MNVFDLSAKLTLDKSNYESGLSKAKELASSVGGAISNAVSTVAKVGAVAVGAGATAVTALTKQAIDAYGNYEQLEGGIAKLFGTGGQSIEEYAKTVGKSVDKVAKEYSQFEKAQQTVMNNADKAYKTAGMSANTYMETVTSFSASLIKSLDGDTAKSAEYADRAIVDMADNANTFGTELQSIQNAYQGFAKENYTMLDNLKLGYGGTKEGMQALIEDASKLTDVQKELGLTVDADSLSFGNIVNAISVMQKSMKIAGTTSREAMGTIQGSMAMTKSAWENLITAFSGKTNSNLDKYFDDLIVSVEATVNNIIPVVEKALPAIGRLIEKVAPIIAEKLPQLVTTLLPPLLDSAVALVKGLTEALPDILSAIYEVLPDVLQSIFDAVGLDVDADGLFAFIDTAIDHIKTLFDELKAYIQPVVDFVVEVFTNIVDGFNNAKDNIDTEALLSLLDKIKEGIAILWEKFTSLKDDIAPAMETAVDAFNKIVNVLNAILENELAVDIIESLAEAIFIVIGAIKTWQIVQTAINLILSLNPIGLVIAGITALIAIIILLVKHWDDVSAGAKACWEAIKQSFEKIGEWFGARWEDIKNVFKGIGDWFKNKFTDAKESVKSSWSNITEFFSEKWEAIKDIFATAKEKFKSIGKNIIDGIKQGVKDAWDTFTDWLFGKFEGVIDGVKELFGIHSPSRVFANIGEMCIRGLEEGSDELFGDEGLEARVSASVKATSTTEETSKLDALLEMLEEYLPNMATKDSFDNVGISINNREFGRLVNGVT